MRLVIDLQVAQGSSRLRGMGRYSRELALAMARASGPHQVVVALNASLPSGDLVDAFAAAAPQVEITLWHGPRGIPANDPAHAAARQAGMAVRARFLADLRPDILHVASIFEGATDDVVSRWPAGLARPVTAATCYDLIPLVRRAEYLDGPWRGVMVPWYLSHLHEMQMADGLLAISAASRQEAIAELGIAPDRIANIRAGVATDFAAPMPDPAAEAALLARYGLRSPYILFLGAGDPRKNEAALLRAFALLPPAVRQRHQLAIVGRADVDALVAEARSLGLAPERDLALITFVEEGDLPALYAGCALFVLPSLHEGFGLPAAEAMACGAPTIASNTSSLPEVVGRDDALFDPADPTAIAACMARVLADDQLRAQLRAHGLARAATFTWQDSAGRAWQALEDLHRACPPRPAGMRLPRLAVSSPLPPQESGIATYSATLLPALARHYDITLVCDRGTTSEERLAHTFPAITPDELLRKADRFDRVLYQIGNSAFHIDQLERLLPSLPGVVALHDAFLSNVLAWRAAQGGGAGFTRTLLRAHGWAAVALAARQGPDEAVRLYPCSLDVVRGALAVIQHSRHAHGILEHHFGAAAAAGVHVVPHLRSRTPPLPRAEARRRLGLAEDEFLVCSFGSVAPTKMPERVLEGWRLSRTAAASRLVFVGETIAATAPLFAPDAPAPRATATGWIDTPTYRLWLAAADLAIQLRRNSRGETSGAIADCLSAGIPLVANAHGSAAELPADTALLLEEACPPQALADAIDTLRHDRTRAAAMAAAGRSLAAGHSVGAIAAAYAEVIEQAWTRGDAAARLAAAQAARETDLGPGHVASVARAIAATWPTARPRQLLVLVDGAPVPWLAGWLAHHPPHLRVHPVTLNGGTLRQDWDTAFRLLALPKLAGPPDAAETGPGDVLLAAPESLPAGLRAELRLRGVRIVAPTAIEGPAGAATPDEATGEAIARIMEAP